jgi:AmiR/NasT family two-component response regulator
VGHVGGPEQENSNSTDIIETTLRPDVVIISRKTKNIVLLELTILSEENAESAYIMNTKEQRANILVAMLDFLVSIYLLS